MKRVLLFLSLLVLSVGCASPPANSTKSADAVETIVRDYSSWTRLFDTPRNVSFALMALCRTQTADEAAYQASEHAQYLVQLYVNPAGAAMMRQEGARVFPEGSVIVKEKWAHDERMQKTSNATQAAGLGILLKEKDGWTFAYVDEKGTITRDQKQLEHCRACHSANQERDAVFYPAVMSQ